MNIKCEGDYMIVELDGEIDEYVSEEIKLKIDEAYNDVKGKDLILDFNKVDFVDSSGIGLILGRYKKVLENNGKVYVVGMQEQVQKVFEISDIYRLVTPYKNMEDLITCKI